MYMITDHGMLKHLNIDACGNVRATNDAVNRKNMKRNTLVRYDRQK